jgi:hypothetical protein
MAALPHTCALTSPKSKGVQNQHFANDEHGTSRTSPENTEKAQGLHFIKGEHGTSRAETSPRARVIESRDIMTPTHGSHDVQHDDDPHNAAPFMNQTPHDVSRGTLYESGHEGSDARMDDQSLHNSELEETKTIRKTLGSRRDRKHTERLSFWSSIPQFPFPATVCIRSKA